MNARTAVTQFTVSFAKRLQDSVSIIEVDVAYGCHWTEVEDNAEIIVECAYAVSSASLVDYTPFMISHEYGDFRFVA